MGCWEQPLLLWCSPASGSSLSSSKSVPYNKWLSWILCHGNFQHHNFPTAMNCSLQTVNQDKSLCPWGVSSRYPVTAMRKITNTGRYWALKSLNGSQEGTVAPRKLQDVYAQISVVTTLKHSGVGCYCMWKFRFKTDKAWSDPWSVPDIWSAADIGNAADTWGVVDTQTTADTWSIADTWGAAGTWLL